MKPIKKFRLPRKTKKKLKNGLYLYSRDSGKSYLMGFPSRSQKDYNDYKNGTLKNIREITIKIIDEI